MQTVESSRCHVLGAEGRPGYRSPSAAVLLALEAPLDFSLLTILDF